MSGLELKQSSLPRPEQLAQLEPGKFAFVRYYIGFQNGYLKAPEKLLGDIVFANWILESQVKVKLSKIIFLTASLSYNLQ